MGRDDKALEDLWDMPASAPPPIDWAHANTLPPLARRYLEHCLGPSARNASAARLRMHGEIRLKDWCPFEAEQVIRFQRGFVWRAKVRMHGLTITGSDQFIDGEGRMKWKMLGILPIMSAEGPDISRSALGRVQMESVWMPSVLLSPDITWEQADETHLGVNLSARDQAAHLDLTLSEVGVPHAMRMMRWGNPEGHEFHEAPFGGLVLAEGTFEGVTIPTKLRIGWHIGSERFDQDGEFFRVTVDHATYR